MPSINVVVLLCVSRCMLPLVLATTIAEEDFGHAESPSRVSVVGALSISARLLGHPLVAEDRELVQSQWSNKVTSLQGLADSAKKLGFATREVRLHTQHPQLEHLPLIVKLKLPNSTTGETRFVVLFGTVRGNRVQVIDYPLPIQLVPVPVLAESWDGYGLYLSTSEASLPAPDSWFGINSPVRILVLPVFAFGASVASAIFWWIRERGQRNIQSFNRNESRS